MIIQMIPINIYALTRTEKIAFIQKLEKHMSKRTHPLTIKKWEIQSLKKFSEHLKDEMEHSVTMRFYYSFQIPKLGKEFDLLRISDDYVINIELKSREVSDEKIKKQLLQNRYYLASLGKTVKSYTYISSSDRLLRLTNSNKLIESNWGKLCSDLEKQTICYEDHIEDLFKEENYLISPFTDPERFLSRDYFLTFQQKDIKYHILKNIHTNSILFQGFTGLPGTGKTLLLYDIALQLSAKQKVCILHFGSFPEELEQMKHRLKRIDFYSCHSNSVLPNFEEYSVIFVDEGHQMSIATLKELEKYAIQEKKYIIFSYDLEDAISPNERASHIIDTLKTLPDFQEYRLTNRIRMNSELSSFIHCMMNATKYHRRSDYPSVALSISNNITETENLLNYYITNGYTYIKDEKIHFWEDKKITSVNASVGICKEFNKVVMLIDSSFLYDEDGYLKAVSSPTEMSDTNTSTVRNLFHGLNRAKNAVAIIVMQNEAVFSTLLSLLQQ